MRIEIELIPYTFGFAVGFEKGISILLPFIIIEIKLT